VIDLMGRSLAWPRAPTIPPQWFECRLGMAKSKKGKKGGELSEDGEEAAHGGQRDRGAGEGGGDAGGERGT